MPNAPFFRQSTIPAVLIAIGLFLSLAISGTAAESSVNAKIPVILDTDIGSDIDDTWALVMMLNSPELDIKLVVSDTGDTHYRAKLIAKLLETAGRTDIPVGVGISFSNEGPYRQGPWIEDYELKDYPGKVHEDGVQALIDTIMNSESPITLVCIGPVPNIAEALKREPRIAEKARFVGMHGSIYKGYGGSDKVSREYNVRQNSKACQAAFQAAWDITITPLDTCGTVILDGEHYQKIRNAKSPLALALIENYKYWFETSRQPKEVFDQRSSVLFDTVAVYLAFSEELLVMKDLGVRVEDDGSTVVDEKAKTIHVAVDWKDYNAFKDLLTARIIKE